VPLLPPIPMTTISKLHFQRLKRLQDVVIELPPKGVIALMGENGIGKSTVLHALACLYKPHEHTQVSKGDPGNWWTDWFIPHTGNLWGGSCLRAYFSDREDGTEYKKTDRWTPRKDQRRERYTRFIGLRDCMPHIEEEKQTSRFEFELNRRRYRFMATSSFKSSGVIMSDTASIKDFGQAGLKSSRQ
ncbi:MAG: ATP-binding cassette domain-containing protein, partial [Nitrosospira sp.]|nr:ATP-binding cassette domain-containing protein [Nitrosospira sp.]